MSFHNYSSYTPCSLPYIKSVPSHWKLKKIAWDIPYHVGWTPASGNEDFYGGDIPWVTISDLDNLNVSSTRSTITELAVDTRKARPIPPGSLLFSFKLSVGKVAFTQVTCFTNEAIAAFEPNGEVDLSYWFYASPLIIPHYGRDNIYGAKLLNQDLIGSAKFFCPTKNEQNQIARFLDHETAKIDALIAEQKRLIKLLQEKRQAVISHAVTKGLDPNVPMKDSGVEWLGEVPAHWRIKPLKIIATCNDEVLPESTHPTREIEYIEISDVSFTKGIKSSTSLSFGVAPSRARRIVRRGDVLISTVRTYLKAITPVFDDKYENLIASTGFAVLRPDPIVASPQFIGNVALANEFISEIISRSVGVSYPAINASEIMRLKIPIPSINEQTEIAKYIEKQTYTLDKLASAANRSIQLMQERRSALISAAVTGKIDVRDWQPPADESALDEEVQKAGMEASV